MNKIPLPYMVRTPWYIKIWVLPVIGVVIFALLPNPTPIAFQLWEQSGWLFRLCMLMAGIGIPIGAANIFFKRTVFSETGISHRTNLLKSWFKSYSEVEAFEYDIGSLGRPESLKIIFLDLSEIVITGGEADVKTVTQIISTHTSVEIRSR